MLFWETKSSDDNWQKSDLMYKHFDSSSEARGWWINNVTDIHSYPLSCPSNTATGWTWSFVSQSESVIAETLASSGTDRGAKTLPMGEDLLAAYTTEMMFLTAKAAPGGGAGVWYISINSSDDWRLCLFRMFKNLKETLTWERDVQDKVLEAFQVFYK